MHGQDVHLGELGGPGPEEGRGRGGRGGGWVGTQTWAPRSHGNALHQESPALPAAAQDLCLTSRAEQVEATFPSPQWASPPPGPGSFQNLLEEERSSQSESSQPLPHRASASPSAVQPRPTPSQCTCPT